MWKRDENVRPSAAREPMPSTPAAGHAAPAAHGPEPEPRRHVEAKDVVNIGRSVVIRGELNGSEDLTVEGHVEGKIELKDNVLTIGPHGRIQAEVFAKVVVVLGQVNGNLSATEKVDLRDTGSVEGNIVAPRVAIAEGAMFRGSVEMQRKVESPKADPPAPKAPEAATQLPMTAAVSGPTPAAAAPSAPAGAVVPKK